MAETRKCTKCGASLPPNSPEGLCVKCSAEQSGTAAQETTAPLPLPEQSTLGELIAPLGISIKVPVRFGDYDLLEEIGHGGMGIVFKARQISLNRLVAVKMILHGQTGNQQAIDRFITEAKAAARLQHPNIVAIHEIGELGGQHFFSMDLVLGQNLSQIAREKPVPPPRAAKYLKKIAEAVHYAHQNGVLHRDINPSNVLIDESDEPRLMDFGLAKLAQDPEKTLPGAVMGAPSYMSPEQATGKTREATAQSDVYSLGAVLYDVLCGRPPFRAETSMETLRQVVEEEPLAPRKMNPRVPRDLETICLKCLEKKPARRFTDAKEMADDLGRFLKGEPIHAREVSRPEKVWRWCRREKTASIAMLIFLLGLAGTSWQWIRAEGQRKTAESATVNALFEQARSSRLRGVAGQRFEALAALQNAAALRPNDDRLRNEAIAVLALPDLRTTTNSMDYPPGTTAVGLSKDFQWQARSDERGVISVLPADGKGKPNVELPGDGTPATLLKFSPNGRLLAARYEKSSQVSVQVWDWENRKKVFASTNLVGESGVDIDSSNRKLAIGTLLGHLQIVDLQTGGILHTNSFRRRCDGLQFDPEGTRLALWSRDSLQVVILDLGTGKETQLNHSHYVRGLDWNKDGRFLATACNDYELYLWDMQSPNRARKFQGHTGPPTHVAFAENGGYLASTGLDKTLRLWELSSGRMMVRLEQIGLPILQFSSDDHWLGCAVVGTNLGLLEVAWPKECRSIPDLHDGAGEISEFTLTSHGRLLAIAASDGVHIWDVETWSESPSIPVGESYRVTQWPGQDGLMVRAYTGLHKFPARRAKVRRDDLLLLGPGRSFDCEWEQGPIAVVTNRSAAASWLLMVAHQDRLIAFDAVTRAKRFELTPPGGLAHMAVSPDGRWIAVVGTNASGVTVWSLSATTESDAVAGSRIAQLGAGGRVNVAFSPDSQRLAAGSQQECRIWNTAHWGLERTLRHEGAAERPSPVAFSQADNLLAWVSSETVVDVVDLSNGRSVALLESPYQAQLTGLQFSPNSERLFAAASSAPLVMWDLDEIGAALGRMQLPWAPGLLRGKPARESAPLRVLVDKGSAPEGVKDLHNIKRLEALLADDPDDFESWKSLGNIYVHTADHEKAAEYLGKAIELKEDDYQCLEWRGDELVFLKRYDEAIAAFKRCLQLRPGNMRSAQRLCYLFLQGPGQCRDLEAGKEYVRECYRIDPANPMTLHRDAALQFRLGNYKQSLELNDRAISANKGGRPPAALLLQAMCLANLRQSAQALIKFDDALAALESSTAYVYDFDYYNEFVDEARKVLEEHGVNYAPATQLEQKPL